MEFVTLRHIFFERMAILKNVSRETFREQT